ncbi:MAG: protein kinase [Rudaea sp.]|nr:protein kinase [Rudaea sp.]
MDITMSNDSPTRRNDTQNRLRGQFDALAELPACERGAWLDAHVPDRGERAALLRLLAADTGSGFLDTPASEHAARLAAEDIVRPEGLIGQQIGEFRIVRALGQGGMAAVFLGERSGKDFRQQAAVKLLRRGLYSELEQRLFLRERRVLAALDHANIARLIDGGVTEAGIPYLVMEYVDGVPITRYAQTHAVDIRARLELFLTVCRAVAAAHRSLIVHRDIKPSNILVSSEGVVKLLDFGIAKLIEEDNVDDATGTAGVFTPGYAAPEQIAGGAITTATDVYGLGVLLHELLLGVRPAGTPTRRPSSLINTHRDEIAVTDADSAVYPIAAARLRKLLRGDLDNILLKALRSEPAQRYATANSFGDDIERYLRRQPVVAHPPSRLYRARKFVQRHRGGVALTLAFLLAILASLGIAVWQANVANQQAVRANAMRDFMVSAFVEAEPSVPREGPPRITEVVEQAIAKARGEPNMNSSARTELLSELGAVLRVQGHLAPARNTLQWTYTQALQEFGEDAALTARAGHELAQTLILTGDYAEARTLVDTLYAHARANDVAIRAKLQLDSALLATKQHELRRALADSAHGLELARTLGNADALADALSESGNVQLTAGDIHAAAATYQELLALREGQLGPQHLQVAAVHAELSRAYRRGGRLDDAEREIRAALAIDALVLPKDDWRHANHLNALTMVLLQRRDFRAALDSAAETLRIDRIAHGNDHPETANDLNNVGMLNAQLQDYGAAVAPLHESLMLSEAKFGAEHYETAVTRANYGVVLARSGNLDAGEAEIRHAIASLAAAAEPDPDEQAATYEKLARLHLDRGDTAAALPLIDRIDALLAQLPQADAYWDGRATSLRATALLQLGQAAKVRPLLAAADAALTRSKNADAVLLVEVPLMQAIAEKALDSPSAAQAFATTGLERLAALRNPPHRLLQLAATVRANPAPAPR